MTAGPNNAYLNFAGGTIKTTTGVTALIPASNANLTVTSTLFGRSITLRPRATTPKLRGWIGLRYDGLTSTLTNVLSAATGTGVTQSDLTLAGGSGYIGAPAVTFSTAGVVAGGTRRPVTR